jgi:NADH dehydrogenase
MNDSIKKIILVGGGFAGMQFAKSMRNKGFNVLLIDKQNHHQFQPLFYQVAGSMLEPSSISFPFRRVFQGTRNLEYRMTSLEKIFPERKVILTDIGEFEYDYLVLALGATTNFFGNESIEKHALGLKSTQQAIKIRNHILTNFEQVISKKYSEQEPYLNIVIVGAGPTGVELSGAFAEMRAKILPKDFTFYDFSKLKIILIEGSPNTLNAMSSQAQEASRNYLEKLGVEIKTNTVVKDYDGHTLTLQSGEIIVTKNLIWAAGVIANDVFGLDAATFGRGKRIVVDRTNKIEGYDSIFALGDLAYMETPLYPNGHPQVANVAINQAKNLAKNLLSGKPENEWNQFEYKDLGSMATIGKNKAVVDLPNFKFKGWFAWVVWMFLHLMLILTVRNKLIILINWAWNYFSKDSTLRIILTNPKKKKVQ